MPKLSLFKENGQNKSVKNPFSGGLLKVQFFNVDFMYKTKLNIVIKQSRKPIVNRNINVGVLSGCPRLFVVQHKRQILIDN